MILSKIQRNIDGTVGYMGDFWSLTAATEQVGYPVSNLLTHDLNQKWVSWGQRASHNWIEAYSDSKYADRTISLVGLLGIDRTNPSTGIGVQTENTFRVIVDQYPIATRRRPPVAAIALTNLVGTVAILNGPLDPPDLVPASYTPTQMTSPNHALNTFLAADFEHYNGSERPLHPTRPQRFRVHYVDSDTLVAFPMLEARVRHNNVVYGSPLDIVKITQSSEGYIIEYQLLANTLPNLTAQIGIQITGTSTGTSTPLPIGLEWIAELDWGTDNESWDSLSQPIEHLQVVSLPKNLSDEAYDIPGNTYRYVYIELSDWIEEIEFVNAPLGGHEGKAFYAGRLAITEGLNIGLKPIGGYNRRKASDINVIRTRGGSFRGSRNPLHWNEHDFSARIQAQQSVLADLEPFFENAGMRNPVVIIPDETVPSHAVYVLLTRWELPDAGAWVDRGNSDHYYDLSFSTIDARAHRTLRQ